MVRNSYDMPDRVAAALSSGQHRNFVGGMWDELGPQQLEALIELGLEAHHTLLDVGCGALRAGRHIVDYLNPGNYHGFDLLPGLIAAGYDTELSPAQRGRLPRENLRGGDITEGLPFVGPFDVALAWSLFSHLPGDAVRAGLEHIRAVLAPDGFLLATLFESDRPDPHPRPDGITTYADRDPFHFRPDEIEETARMAGFTVSALPTDHPRAQTLFVLRPSPIVHVPSHPVPPLSAPEPTSQPPVTDPWISVLVPNRGEADVVDMVDDLRRQAGLASGHVETLLLGMEGRPAPDVGGIRDVPMTASITTSARALDIGIEVARTEVLILLPVPARLSRGLVTALVDIASRHNGYGVAPLYQGSGFADAALSPSAPYGPFGPIARPGAVSLHHSFLSRLGGLDLSTADPIADLHARASTAAESYAVTTGEGVFRLSLPSAPSTPAPDAASRPEMSGPVRPEAARLLMDALGIMRHGNGIGASGL